MKKKVLILGIDGYIGWALANELKSKDYDIYGVDNFWRRNNVESLYPISTANNRWYKLPMTLADVQESSGLIELLKKPLDAIIHLAEQPSAPFSMTHEGAMITQKNNVLGTLNLLFLIKKYCPSAHLIKIGTMGEYGTPDCVIPEGMIPSHCIDEELHYCPMQGLMFPRSPGSFYHLSKVFDSLNIKFACDTWGLRSTDIMQGIVFGLAHETRFDYDENFGTVINRFCAQVLTGIPLTIYGEGGQTRGFLPLTDSLKCLQLAIDNPPTQGYYRTFNQFAHIMTIQECAELVSKVANSLGLVTSIQYIPNPRKESEDHAYHVVTDNLHDLGYEPNLDFTSVIRDTLLTLMPYKHLINKDIIYPTTNWR
jgi:UDP-sulfoquinovose synthase